MSKKNRYSSKLFDGDERAPGRSMMYPLGLKKGDFKKPFVGIASTWATVTPCNLHIKNLADTVIENVKSSGGNPILFNTITVSDGISMGTTGMKYSLISREVIADSIETVVEAQGLDGFVAIGGCDKNMPGCFIAMARLNRPSLFIYGGSIAPGAIEVEGKKKDVDIVSVFESVGQKSKGIINQKQFEEVEAKAIPGAGSCGGMYTANTMAIAIEILGMSLPMSSCHLALSQDKNKDCKLAGEEILRLVESDLKPSDILTKQSFINAATITLALGGSTNSVLHFLAMAKAANVDFTLDDFDQLGTKVPLLADLRPSGQYMMKDFIEIGGIGPLVNILIKEGLLDGSCLTVTGKTLAENYKDSPAYPETQRIIRSLKNPIKDTGHLVILRGNLAPEGSVAKITGKEGTKFTGTAITFSSEEEALKAILNNQVKKGHVLIIRYEGPKGGPGMREMLSPTSAIIGKGLDKDVALITDGRFSGGSHGFVIGHVTPEASMGGPIALVKDGDEISIDTNTKVINLKVSPEILEERKKVWKAPDDSLRSGILKKYSRLFSSASEGATTV